MILKRTQKEKSIFPVDEFNDVKWYVNADFYVDTYF